MSQRSAAREALKSVNPADAAALIRACTLALQNGLEAEAEPLLAAATISFPGEARLWQLLGLARRGMQDSAGAHRALDQAAALAPADPLIAHSQARTALEAGLPALAHFNRARLLDPANGEVALGRLSALFAEGEGAKACEQLATLLDQSTGWTEGHLAYARLAAQTGIATPIDHSLRRALARHPGAGGLWRLILRVRMEAHDYRSTLAAVGEARAALGADPELDRIEAICLSELNEPARAQALFDRLAFPGDAEAAIWPIRNYIRLGELERARLLAEQSFDDKAQAALWPYRALLWRALDDPRWQWLEGQAGLVEEYDIAAEIGPIEDLADLLRGLHKAKGEPLDQSVRGGTQTDGNLLARAEPEIRRLRSGLLGAVRHYVGQLPPRDPDHPTLCEPRDDIRVAGAWSVRLTDQGFHADHVHWQGWISSAFYLTVPETSADDPAGSLLLGAARDLLPDLPAFRTVKPVPGKLVLFPSTMWHGTLPFGSGERMTVAFDIARPWPTA